MTATPLATWMLVLQIGGGFGASVLAPGRLLAWIRMPIDRLAAAVAGQLNAKCWSVASFRVQIRGSPMCLASSSALAFDQGRQARVMAIKALGLSFAMLTGRAVQEDLTGQAEDHIQRFTQLLYWRQSLPVVTPPAILQAVVRARVKSEPTYELSALALALYADHPVRTGTPPVLDQFALALVTRSMLGAQELSGTTATVANQVALREGAIGSGKATGAEATRLGVELTGAQTAVSGALSTTRAAQAQSESYAALRSERKWLLNHVRTSTMYLVEMP